MKPIDVLFLCETNAATSLMAEAIVNHRNDTRIRAFSAGRAPTGVILPEARAVLAASAIPAEGLEPKPWTIFALQGAPRADIVVDLATVTWTAPEVKQLADSPVIRWPLRDASLIESARERRLVAEAVFDALESRIGRDLLPLVLRSAATLAPRRAAVGLSA
ncbi:arsenate reductase ArsC [Chthonobacter albigriseus]|uniref:arsenate reductase/protein-tyrosine-phosphatase family protein n=1 Tax=Chthonobacter albigriseus TaxID=1683161 RepID=UPI0015EEBB4E|nr:arsenate reductase ArsC [Chthonobacter albigriseus]